jgi:hypothetical protein
VSVTFVSATFVSVVHTASSHYSSNEAPLPHKYTHTHTYAHKESLGKEDKIKAAEADVERAKKRVDDALEGAFMKCVSFRFFICIFIFIFAFRRMIVLLSILCSSCSCGVGWGCLEFNLITSRVKREVEKFKVYVDSF